MTDLVRDGAGRVVGVVLRDQGGRTWTERAELVVGADGRDSVVAAGVARTAWRRAPTARAYVYGYWPAAGLDGYHWYYGHGLSAGVIPTNDGLACVFAGGPPARLAAALRHRDRPTRSAALLARLDGGLADLVAAPPVGPVRVFRGLPARLRRPYGPGWALVGDAG